MFIGTFPAIKYLLTFVGWDWVGLGAVSSLSLLRVALGRAWCYPAHCSSLRYVLCWMRGLKTAALSFIIYANLISLSSPVWIMTVRKSTGVHLIHLSVSQTQQPHQNCLIESSSKSMGQGCLIIIFLILQMAKLRHGRDRWLSLMAEWICDGSKPSAEGALIP